MANEFHLYLLGISVALIQIIAFAAGDNCDLSRWSGTWYQKGEDLIKIEGFDISSKGRCIEASGDEYVFTDNVNGRRSFHCLIIVEAHRNILQYKEVVLMNNTTLDACAEMPADAPLYSLIRVNATPIACPWKGSFNFTYATSGKECKSPISTIQSCMEDSRMLVRYQACPDVPGSESKAEELTCLATWSKETFNFVVVQIHSLRAKSSEEKHRCIIYEEASLNVLDLYLSADVACNSVQSPLDGPSSLKLTKNKMRDTCDYPDWMTSSPSWHAVGGPTDYVLTFNNDTAYIFSNGSDEPIRKMVCEVVAERKKTIALFSARVNQACQNFYVCVYLERQVDSTVVMQLGTLNQSPREACERYFDISTAERVTLIDFKRTSSIGENGCSNSKILETEETKPLSTAELQRLVLLEQLSLVRLQKVAICQSSAAKAFLNTTTQL